MPCYLQPSFYVAVSTFAAGFVLYRITNGSEDSWVTRLIQKYTPDEKVFEERSAIHTAALEKAASDRHLFAGTPRQDYIDLRTPEYAYIAVLLIYLLLI